jgi:hypothetical protein
MEVGELLDAVLDAHGGVDRWRAARVLRVRATVDGELWGRRGQEGVLREARLHIDPHRQRVTFERFKAPDHRGLFEASRDAIETDDGTVIEERLNSASAFTKQTRTSHWDDLQLVHSAGFDLWHFFAQPFVLAMPGVETEEIEPWEEAGESWRRLRAVFPDGLIAHAREQTYSFNSAGLLRRFEYAPARPGVPANINYAADHREFDGLIFATRRRMLPNDGTGAPLPEPVLMSVEVSEVAVG